MIKYNFTVQSKPLSYTSQDAGHKQRYKLLIGEEFRKKYKNPHCVGYDLYSIVYYFRPSKDLRDADNISKHIWDALTSVAYLDDRQIKYRVAGIIDVDSFSRLDLSRLGSREYKRIVRSFDREEDLLYIEIGKYAENLHSFCIGV